MPNFVSIGNYSQWKPIDSMDYTLYVPSAESPESVYLVFGRRLRKLRDQRRMAQHELALLSGLTRASIANIESGRQRVLLHQILQFAGALQVEISDLVPTTSEVELELENDNRASTDNYYLQRLIEALEARRLAENGNEKDNDEKIRRTSTKGVRNNRATNSSAENNTRIRNIKSRPASK